MADVFERLRRSQFSEPIWQPVFFALLLVAGAGVVGRWLGPGCGGRCRQQKGGESGACGSCKDGSFHGELLVNKWAMKQRMKRRTGRGRGGMAAA